MKALEMFLKYVLGPILAAALSWYFSTAHSDQNHGKSAKGYEVLAESINNHILGQVDRHEMRLDGHEGRIVALEFAVPPKASWEPTREQLEAVVAAFERRRPKPQPSLKVPAWATKAPASAPAMKLSPPPPAYAPRPPAVKMMKRVPERL